MRIQNNASAYLKDASFLGSSQKTALTEKMAETREAKTDVPLTSAQKDEKSGNMAINLDPKRGTKVDKYC